ncbi:hypothetical protein SteCoe_29745 [Stentor coeruleus]|uniref:Uncharacterized protein n=1 Tax=Stentor coeruleus TaxID=5963 RepID=A0A1R2B5A1_9CILI|nr:hypothetical protein SteCoe_29745 [Stentor coeruleus]
MSIYSGFATRNLETAYNRGLCQMIVLCQQHLLLFLRNGIPYIENVNVTSLSRSFNKIFRNLKSLESHKHLEPKFTEYCSDLASHLGYEEHVGTSCGQSSHATLNSDMDFHILNDVLAYDSSRASQPKAFIRKAGHLQGNATPKESYNNNVRRASRKSLNSRERPPRTTSTRVTPNIYESKQNRSFYSVTKPKRNQRIDPAQLYHDQAMSLLYSYIES